MAALFTSTWGDPTATKHVLLIHGITFRPNSGIASRRSLHFEASYFVTAPDLLGHGNARRNSDYTIATLAEELRPLFATAGGNDHPYHVVVGHSLGGIVAAALFPFLKSTRPVRVVLVDPPLEMAPESTAFYRKLFGDIIRNPKTPEAYLKEFPLWTKEDAIFYSMSVHLCDVALVEAIFDQNDPWSFSHQLSTVADNIKVIVLAADPSNIPCVIREEELKPYPHVTAKTVLGASHMIPLEFPLVVVETALEGI
ncbi:Alpha/Beta hydrolase protein [Boletus coccyginus]|nr:Alpha/Beta hydrolase protein [Boletus coccyginus]